LLPRKKHNNQCTGKTISPTPFSNTTAVASACPYEPGKTQTSLLSFIASGYSPPFPYKRQKVQDFL